MESAAAQPEVQIAVPQRCKDFVVGRQYRWFWYILVGVLGGVNAIYYLLSIVLHWKGRIFFLQDMTVLVMGLIAYVWEARKPWYYELNEHRIKLFLIHPKLQIANLKELEWAKTEVVGVEQDEWEGLPCLKLKVLPASSYSYILVYSHADEEEVRTKVLPLIEKYRHQYRQPLWADKLRS